MSQHFSWWEAKEGGFFRKPPAFHRLLFMSPFAGDIGAEPGSLKWIAQIPRKACRWALKGNSKKVFGSGSGYSRGRKTLSCVPTKHEQLEQLHFCLCRKRPRKKKKHFGCGIHFVDLRSRIFSLEGGWRLSRTHTPNQTWLLPKNAVRRWGYAKQHPQSILQLFSSCFINNKQQQAKHGPYTLKGGVVK